MAGYMAGLVVFCVIAVGLLLYAADRMVKARSQARRVREMSERLAAAAARAEEQHEERRAQAAASAALTSVVPAINHPVLTSPGEEADEDAPAD